MNSFMNALNAETSRSRTENGAATFSTTTSPLVDLFALGGAYRSRSVADKRKLFALAFDEDWKLATKCLFYLRDVRGGQGERDLFRANLPFLFENIGPQQREPLARLIAEYGRWDDLFTVYAQVDEVQKIVQGQFFVDAANMTAGAPHISLLAKWMPSINTSSKESVLLAKRIAKDLGYSHKQYRQTLSALRSYLDVMEKKMSSNRWEEINLETIPSQARLRHKKALYKHLPDKMAAHIKAVEKGEEKVNSATLYPYQIVEKLQPWTKVEGYYASQPPSKETQAFYETLWNNLPNYVKGDQKALVVADTSGSMWGTPISVALSLALYFAERNTGAFANQFITFSSKPKLQKIPSRVSLYDKLVSMAKAGWGMNTDIDAVFNLLLRAAQAPGVAKEDVPTTIYIVSDMEFDRCALGANRTNLERAQELFEAAGLTLPQIIFWNVNARHDNLPVRVNEAGVSLVSGCSPSIFQQAIKKGNPYDLMIEVLNGKRYDAIDKALE